MVSFAVLLTPNFCSFCWSRMHANALKGSNTIFSKIMCFLRKRILWKSSRRRQSLKLSTEVIQTFVLFKTGDGDDGQGCYSKHAIQKQCLPRTSVLTGFAFMVQFHGGCALGPRWHLYDLFCGRNCTKC